jgi:O-antigen/teichoic acid export membrane protein
MAGIKTLAKETMVYGLSSIVGRFLNWCLVPLYVYVFPTQEYGIVSYLYSFMAVALVILNYGMETGFFRYANKDDNPMKVYTTTLISVGTTSLLFIILLTLFLRPLSAAILLPNHSLYVWMLGVIVAIDAFCNIPFAYLRYKRKAFRFAGIKIVNVFVNIGLNLFFILGCPELMKHCPQLISWFYEPLGGADFGIGWIFVANMISTLVVFIMLLPQIIGIRYRFDIKLLRSMLKYSWPLLVLGVAGIMSQNMGQLVIPYLFKDNAEAARSMVGIYGANIKIAIIMVMFTQAFRYAYEPFIFSQAKQAGTDKTKAYADAMKFFVIFGLAIFLGVMYFMPVLKHFVSPSYWVGLQVVPIMMMAELFFGVFFNLSLWYKLTDRTVWGMYFSLIGFVLMLVLNIWLVPLIGIPNGYMGSAWAAFISYFVIMVLSYFVGRKYYPIEYPVKRIMLYTLLAGILWGVGSMLEFTSMMWLTYLLRIILLAIYVSVIALKENVPVLSSLVHRLIRR